MDDEFIGRIFIIVAVLALAILVFFAGVQAEKAAVKAQYNTLIETCESGRNQTCKIIAVADEVE